MKDNKICFSKTLVYLVLLLVVVVGGYFVMQAANTARVGSTPKASTGDCTVSVSGVNYKVQNQACVKDVVPYFANTSYICNNGNPWGKSTLCNPVAAATACTYQAYGKRFTVPVGTCLNKANPVDGVNPPTTSEKCVSVGYMPKMADCANTSAAPSCPANQITSVSTDVNGTQNCTFYTGSSSNGRCLLGTKAGSACAPGVGSLLAGATAVTCTANQITYVGTYSDGSKYCQYQTGRSYGGRCLLGVKGGSACDPGVGNSLGTVSAATGCNIPYNGQTFAVTVGNCLKDAGAVNGVQPPTNSIKCKADGVYGKDPLCSPKCGDYKACAGGVAMCAFNSAQTAQCGCFDTTSTTEQPSMTNPADNQCP